MKKALLSVLFFIFIWSMALVQAQTIQLIHDEEFGEDAKKAIDFLYNRQNDAADEELFIWKKKYPDHPIWTLWDGMEIWWKILEDLNDTSHDEAFAETMKKADYQASRLLHREPDHPDALIVKAVANSYVARMYSNRESWVTSLQIGRKGYEAHQRLLEVAPELPDNLFAEGIQKYYSAYIPETYTFLKAVSWFLPDGSREEGLKALKNAADNAVFARPEANYFLAYIYLNYEGDGEKAKFYFNRLVENYPSNGYYRRLYMRTLAQLDEYHEMDRFFENTMENRDNSGINSDPITEAELWYWYGRFKYQSSRYDSALDAFKKSVQIGKDIDHFRDREAFTMAAYYAGRVSEIKSDHENARHYYGIAASQDAAPNARKDAERRQKSLR
jgi:hypothetical protein